MVTASTRLICIVLATPLFLAGCDVPDQARYASWADKVSTIPLEPASSNTSPARDNSAETRKVKVELMTPHQLWDARNGPLSLPAIDVAEALPVVAAAMPALQAQTEPQQPSLAANAPTSAPSSAPTRSAATALIQLGAFSSQSSAQAAWERLANSSNGQVLTGLSPQFETVSVNGRTLVRLRVAASQEQAANLCKSLASSDPWCQKPRS